jgi:hypothetical protein
MSSDGEAECTALALFNKSGGRGDSYAQSKKVSAKRFSILQSPDTPDHVKMGGNRQPQTGQQQERPESKIH